MTNGVKPISSDHLPAVICLPHGTARGVTLTVSSALGLAWPGQRSHTTPVPAAATLHQERPLLMVKPPSQKKVFNTGFFSCGLFFLLYSVLIGFGRMGGLASDLFVDS